MRRPISRRLMVALFLLVLAPMSGWYFATELTAPELLTRLESSPRAAVLAWEVQTRRKLTCTFVAAVLIMGAVVVYVRRALIDPLGDLAARARRVGGAPWSAPQAGPAVSEVLRARPDEIGDLSRALHDSVTALEARAEEAVRFAVSLSHELRTPLAAIKGAAEVLSDGELTPEERARFVANIAAESERLERLVAGLLDLERARQGRGAEPTCGCHLGNAVRQVMERAAPSWTRKGLAVEVLVQDDLPIVALDEDRVARVLLGLLENAVKFSPREGRVQVSARRDGADGVLTVEDAGPGVPDPVKPRIFDRAFVGDRASGARGTGLGLAIVHSLVAGAGGAVAVEDGAAGGARFVVRLPGARPGGASSGA